MPLDLLFPATVTKRHQSNFYNSKRTQRGKKGFLNDKVYNLLAVIDLNKINI